MQVLVTAREATLGQTTVQRHLTALKTDFVEATRTRLLAFVTTACGFAQSGADTSAHTPPGVFGTFGWLQVM
jgi:hypothetical protein